MSQCKKYYAMELSIWGDSVYVFDSKTTRSNWLKESGNRIPVLAKQLRAQDKQDIKDPEYMDEHYIKE